MSKKIRLTPIKVRQEDGTFKEIDAIGGNAGGAVESVNGKTGVVTLSAEDVGALSKDTKIPEEYNDTEVRQLISGKQDKINDLSAIRSGAASGATALQPDDVPGWAKQAEKPTYNAAEVGALPADTKIPEEYDDTAVRGLISEKYTKPQAGIPESDLTEEVKTKLNAAKPVDGIVEWTDSPSENNQLYFPKTAQTQRYELPEPGELEGIKEDISSLSEDSKYTIHYEESGEDEYDEYVLYDEYTKGIADLDDKITKESKDREDGLKDVRGDLSQKLTEPAGAQVGQFFRVASIDADGHYVLEAVDAPSGGVTDVQVAGSSIVQDGVAAIPPCKSPINNSGGSFGVVRGASYGLFLNSVGAIQINIPTDLYMRSRSSTHSLTLNYFDKMLKFAMTDGKGEAWTAEEQAAAQQRMGIVTLTQEEYDLLEAPSESTIYIIVEATT